MDATKHRLRLVALGGGLVALLAHVVEQGTIELLALRVAVAVVVPLGLALAATEPSLPLRAAATLLPLDALVVNLGFHAPTGSLGAVACAAVHFLVCAAIGLHGLTRAWRRRATRFLPLSELAIDVGQALLPVGAIWLAASRAGVGLMGFREPIVFFTGAHFHYAGFAAPVVIGATGRFLAERPRVPFAIAAGVVCAGVPLTAVGISTTHTVEVSAALFLAAGMLVASAMLAVVAARAAWSRSRAAAGLFVIAGLTLLGTMALAASFATTSSAGRGSTLDPLIPMPTMIALHGGGNAFGFALAALVALTLIDLEAVTTRRPK